MAKGRIVKYQKTGNRAVNFLKIIRGKEQEVREFGATTRELLELADWLTKGECQMVAMESTTSYWKPLYNILESSGLKAMVVNARHMKAVPGRKTDV